ncbi:MAG: 50S ribosomal protein L23 [Actinobacteria bacterium]|nr:50S ribosomal protein L23 [Actinomycetota bacterium]
MRNPEDIIIAPIITEKSYRLANEENKYSFRVHPDANKIEIKNAVEKLFNVKVLSVNTINVKPKKKRLGKFEGRTNRWKKAVVTLKEGDRIEFFAAS